MNKYPHGGVAYIDATVHFFDSSGQIEWYWRLFKKGFWHVAVTLTDVNGREVTVDPRMTFIDVVREEIAGFRLGSTNLRIKRRIPLSDPPWAILAPGTCVTIVKACLGIRAWWVLTPYQLYKYLKKHGSVA